MAVESVFHQLSQSISADEREQLLNRIQSSLHLNRDDSATIVHKTDDSTRRKQRIQADMMQLGLKMQLQLWLSSFFSVKSTEDRFVQIRVQNIIKKIRQIDPELISDDGEYIGAALARHVEVLSRYAQKLKPFFDKIWKDDNQIAEYAARLAQLHIPQAKQDLFDFIDRESLENGFRKTRNSQLNIQRLSASLKKYLESIHPDTYGLIEQELSPLYYLRGAVMFPYENFLVKFRGKNGYHGARFQIVREELEQLYFAGYIATRWTSHSKISPVITGDSEETAKKIKDFAEVVRDYFLNLPLAEIIKAGALDPYYRFMVYVPRIDIRRFLGAYLELTLLQQYEKEIPYIRIDVVCSEIMRIFHQKWQNPLRHILPYQFKDSQRIGLPVIRRVYSLGMYYDYVKEIFGARHESLALMISRAQARRIRQTNSDMLIVLSSIDDIADKIDKLNQTLSPDSSEGQELRRLRLLLKHDPGMQRQYRAQIGQMDRAAQELSNRSIETLSSLRSQFSSYREHIGNERNRIKKSLSDEIVWLDSFIEAIKLVAAVEDEYPQDAARGLSRISGMN